MSELHPSTAERVIDELQDLQRVANRIKDQEAKIAWIRKGLGFLGTHQLLEAQFAIGAGRLLAQEPDAAPEDRLQFRNGLFFVGSLDSLAYMLDEDVPIDELSLNFTQPEVWDTDPEHAQALRACTFQVPILSVEERIYIPAA